MGTSCLLHTFLVLPNMSGPLKAQGKACQLPKVFWSGGIIGEHKWIRTPPRPWFGGSREQDVCQIHRPGLGCPRKMGQMQGCLGIVVLKGTREHSDLVGATFLSGSECRVDQFPWSCSKRVSLLRLLNYTGFMWILRWDSSLRGKWWCVGVLSLYRNAAT